MAIQARIPPELRLGPFSVGEARAVGVSYTALQGKSWRRVGRGLYCWAYLPDDPWKHLCAFQRASPQSLFSGLSAAWLYGIDCDPLHPVEVIVPRASEMRSRPGVTVHHIDLPAEGVTCIRGLRATTVPRMFIDVRRGRSRLETLVIADAALRLGLGRLDELAEPAESPMETRLRWILVRAGLPRPQVQTKLFDHKAGS